MTSSSHKNSQQNISAYNKPTNDDFNKTFFLKGYDEVNPYLNKNSVNRGRLTKKFTQIEDNTALEESLLSESSLGRHPLQIQNCLKLPKLNEKHSEKEQKQRNKRNLKSTKKSLQKVSNRLNFHPKEISEKVSNLKNVVLDTRIETDDQSIIQTGSSASFLKISRQSIEFQPSLCLKINKISNNQNVEQYSHRNFLKRQNLISQQNHSQFISLTIPRTQRIPNITILQEQTTSSQSEDQYIKDSVPGPGYYSVSHHSSFSKPQTRRRYSTKNYEFGSKQSRFKINKKLEEQDSLSQLKLQAYQQKQRKRQQRLINLNKKSKKHIPFNSKEQSKKQNPENNFTQKMISPVYYNPRYGMEQELIKKVQRNFKGKFGSDEKRFKTIYRKPYNLGPGSYSIDFKSDQQDNKRVAHFFSSKRPRFQ